MANKEERLTRQQLRERGWTNLLIRKHLGEPDEQKPNPVYRSQSPMKLWSEQRVCKTELVPEVSAAINIIFARRDARKVSSAKAVATKRQEILDSVESLKVEIPEWSYPELVHLACDHYNQYHHNQHHLNSMLNRREYFNSFEKASPKSSPEFLYRIVYNFLRHEPSQYEEELVVIAGKTGREKAYNKLKEKINTAISTKYPGLWAYLDEQHNQFKEVQEGS